ncbi:receptor kinase-like protein Xa21 [Solanum stenotomum]|uniref:receptor kinase-like protein Xa21 n=1 Tax=Solanum stenotomum TaxID=172797 RepID=UPI0020D12564|nr:receptor kinase-like protein Xa21 [Solanum stenotomum]
MEANNLTGSIPFSVFNISGIEVIGFTQNTLSGNLPANMCDRLPALTGLHPSLNKLQGQMPLSLPNCSKLQILSLSSNEFDGPIHREIGRLSSMQNLYLGKIHLKGRIPQEIGIFDSLVNLEISRNQLTGQIPISIFKISSLKSLALAENNLFGPLSREVGNLTKLQYLLLSENMLTGLFPTSLEKLQNLKYFNGSFNKLVGEIPSSGPFKNLSGQSFISNEALCGSPRFLCIRGKRKQAVDSSYVVSTRGRISYYELLRATDSLSESNLIGSGSFGSVYKGILREGTSIAAKVFNLQLQAAFRSFDTKCQFLRNLRHRNLTKVITSCSNLEFKALVPEYMSNGSLDKWLYSHNYSLYINHHDI